jgi:hypothetical protein
MAFTVYKRYISIPVDYSWSSIFFNNEVFGLAQNCGFNISPIQFYGDNTQYMISSANDEAPRWILTNNNELSINQSEAFILKIPTDAATIEAAVPAEAFYTNLGVPIDQIATYGFGDGYIPSVVANGMPVTLFPTGADNHNIYYGFDAIRGEMFIAVYSLNLNSLETLLYFSSFKRTPLDTTNVVFNRYGALLLTNKQGYTPFGGELDTGYSGYELSLICPNKVVTPVYPEVGGDWVTNDFGMTYWQPTYGTTATGATQDYVYLNAINSTGILYNRNDYTLTPSTYIRTISELSNLVNKNVSPVYTNYSVGSAPYITGRFGSLAIGGVVDSNFTLEEVVGEYLVLPAIGKGNLNVGIATGSVSSLSSYVVVPDVSVSDPLPNPPTPDQNDPKYVPWQLLYKKFADLVMWARYTFNSQVAINARAVSLGGMTAAYRSFTVPSNMFDIWYALGSSRPTNLNDFLYWMITEGYIAT